MKIQTVYLVVVFLNVSVCFFAQEAPTDTGWNTKTHYEITNIGCLNAITKYIIAKKNATSLSNFFKKDMNSHNKMLTKVAELSKDVADTQKEVDGKDYMHCHSDQIFYAHKEVKRCRTTLADVTSDFDVLRKRLARCLYIIQSFYSNTNWIEMNGAKVYEDFGTGTLMEVVKLDEDTCVDVPAYDGICENNLIIHNKLTSSYYQDRGRPKPARPKGSTRGKCSHGGPSDRGRTSIARCGINKDTTSEKYSPHKNLHMQAFIAAMRATVHFLSSNENGTGVLDILGERIFDSLFHLKVRLNVSLAFAIDYTGSMTEEMSGVKENVIQRLTSTISSSYEPTNYILSMFHDPVSWNKVFTTTDGMEMIHKIQEIQTVQGENKDCPEYAMAGLLNAIEKILPKSPLLFFTDADAKDKYRENEVIEAVKAKEVKVEYFITNECSSKRDTRQGKVEMTRNIGKLIQKQQAEGIIGRLTSQLNMARQELRSGRKLFPSGEIIVDSFQWSTSMAMEQQIAIDSSISVLKISVKGSSVVTDIDVIDSHEQLETFLSGKAIRIRTEKGETIVSLQRPSPGIMKVRRNKIINLYLNITAQSDLNAEVNIYQDEDHGNLIRVTGNPIAEKRHKIYISVFGLKDNGTLEQVLLVSRNDAILIKDRCIPRDTTPTLKCYLNVTMPSDDFRIKVIGIDDNGYNFTRVASRVYKPTTVQLNIKSTIGDAVLNRESPIYYEITHFANISETFVVSVSSSHTTFLLQPISRQHVFVSQDNVNGVFFLKPLIPSIIMSFTVTVTTTTSTDVLQSITRKLLITDVERPICSIMNVSGTCGESSLNTANCSFYKWTANSNILYSGVRLQSIEADDPKVVVQSQNFTDLMTGPLEVKLYGDCCVPYVHLTVLDENDWIAQCKIDYGNGAIVASVELSTPSSFEYHHLSTVLTIAIASAVSAVVTLVFVCYVLKKSMNTPMCQKYTCSTRTD